MAEKAQPVRNLVSPRIPESLFVIKIWNDYRPYLIGICVDLLVSASLYVAAFAFEFLNSKLPLQGWIGMAVLQVHGLFAVAAICTFLSLSINDIVQVHRRQRGTRT
jgi:hypothetical protein